MNRSILIVDANPGLAAMLQQALSAVGFDCTLALTGREAFQTASGKPVDLAIVDFHLPDGPAEELIRAFQKIRPEMILLGIPPDNDPENPVIAELGIQGALTKPFYLPDLVPYIAGLLGVEAPPLAESGFEEGEESELDLLKPPAPKKSTRLVPWLENAGKAGAWLDRLASENSVRACLITRGDELHAGAGEFSRDKLSLIARHAAEIWAVTPGGTVMQYVRIPPDNEEVFLFSISIALDYDLTLLFDRKTSVSAARRRAKNFEKALDTPPATGVFRRSTAEFAASRRKTGELGMPKPRTGDLIGAMRKTGELGGPKRKTGDLPRKPGSITDELRRARLAHPPADSPDNHDP
ncbi:MAG: response regulator [Anaerolineales bacterium]|nr:response regulator [Anaerolineales bacterium]